MQNQVKTAREATEQFLDRSLGLNTCKSMSHGCGTEEAPAHCYTHSFHTWGQQIKITTSAESLSLN